jgi:ATP-dependent DNA helicase MPH1
VERRHCASEQNDLEHHYQNIGTTSPQFIRFPRNDAFPRLLDVLCGSFNELQTWKGVIARESDELRRSGTDVHVKHGSLTRRMIKTLQKMHEAGPDCEHRFKDILALTIVVREPKYL